MTAYFISIFLKIFFLLTPFAAVSGFISMTSGCSSGEKRKIALQTTVAMLAIVSLVFFFGQYIFDLFGITLNAFRVGGGALLFLAGVSLVRGGHAYEKASDEDDIAVVPMAIPLIVGPGTLAALFIMGAEVVNMREKMVALSAVLLAVLCVGGMLFLTVSVERHIKQKFIIMLTKITGLILASLAAQIIFDGIKGFLG
ncbi:MAG TPA: MarC family protein [Phycisphaerae bacterium]|nr:MarC family protein [Phycisphaerae bacterium]HPS53689.1 MarC family protein [Phycisphaerae bacterium]